MVANWVTCSLLAEEFKGGGDCSGTDSVVATVCADVVMGAVWAALIHCSDNIGNPIHRLCRTKVKGARGWCWFIF